MTLLERLERGLGDPWDPSNPFSFTKIMASDDKEEFPRDRLAVLDRLKFGTWMVPSSLGGAMSEIEEMLAAARAVTRRDTTVALAKGVSVLGSLPIWIDGTEAQKKRIAEIVVGGGLAALGLTEHLNGSDLARSVMQLKTDSSGSLVLDGEKWLINNATQGDCICVLAKSASGHAIVFVEKMKMPHGSFAHTPKIRLMGVKGLDVSGIRFTNAKVSSDAIVGREGRGLEIALKGLIVSRLLCIGFLLGMLETALRLTFEFCEKRQLYDGTALTLPIVRSRLAASYADFHLIDLYGRACARALSLFPEQGSLHSAAAKYYLPELAEKALHDVHVTLGARYYLAEEFAFGVMQKTARDLPLVGLFDGSSQVNLGAIASQLPAMGNGISQSKIATDSELRLLFDDRERVAFPDLKKLRLTARGEDVILATFLALESKVPGVQKLKEIAREILSEVSQRPRTEPPNQRYYFDLAAKWACLRAGAIVALDANANSREESALTRYLVSRVLEKLGAKPSLTEEEMRECESQIFDELSRRVRGDVSFGLEESALPGWYGRLKSEGFSK